MGQRQKATTATASRYKYANLVECEENEDFHVVRPTVWPPRAQGIQTSDPTVPLQCELCGAWIIAQKAHATGELPGVRVILPAVVAPSAQTLTPKRRGGRPRKVVETPQVA